VTTGERPTRAQQLAALVGIVVSAAASQAIEVEKAVETLTAAGWRQEQHPTTVRSFLVGPVRWSRPYFRLRPAVHALEAAGWTVEDTDVPEPATVVSEP
jgi:hypothetical protein